MSAHPFWHFPGSTAKLFPTTPEKWRMTGEILPTRAKLVEWWKGEPLGYGKGEIIITSEFSEFRTYTSKRAVTNFDKTLVRHDTEERMCKGLFLCFARGGSWNV